MIVCICHNINDKQIRHAAANGMQTMSALREELGLGTQCGKCAGCARKILREEDHAVRGVMFVRQLVPHLTSTPNLTLVNA